MILNPRITYPGKYLINHSVPQELRRISSATKRLEESYNVLNLPMNTRQEDVKKAFLELAKKYHPDSGSSEANIEKFVEIENAFRTISKHNTGAGHAVEVEKIVFDIKHTAPQHRQYLSFEGQGHGTPSQRMHQWQQARAQKAAENIMEHRIAKSMATEKTIMKKDGQYFKKHAIKTKYGFDRLVEDLIQESMSKGEFDNLSGKGKPLQGQNRNPYVDFTTHKLNEVLINNGFTPEWIMMNKEIEQDIIDLKKQILADRSKLGPVPLTLEEDERWAKISECYRDVASSLNSKINTFNLIVPLLNKQKFHVDVNSMLDDALNNGPHFVSKSKIKTEVETVNEIKSVDDILGTFLKAFTDIFGKK